MTKYFPAIQGSLGTWRYYNTKMTAAQISEHVKFADEVWESKALDHWLQRARNESRAYKQISGYLARHDDRFFNSIVIAALDGDPKFYPVEMTADPRFEIIGDDELMTDSFGILKFNGRQIYYALDGQHRLTAIKGLIDKETDFIPPEGFRDEEFSVIIVVQKEDESKQEFMKKYRRLFSHLNRHAKPMDTATTIIMEEDDAFAILTRRLIQEHPFFSWMDDGENTRVRCLRGKNISVNEPYFTTIITLYAMTIELLSTPARINDPTWAKDGKEFQKNRPADDRLDELYDELAIYWDAILELIPVLKNEPRIMRSNLSEDRVTDEETITNHLLFRPIGQELLADLVREMLNMNLTDIESFTKSDVKTAIKKIGRIDWRLFNPPWRHLLFVYDRETDKWKMRSDDRKNAVSQALNMAKWLVGCDTYHTEEEVNQNLRDPWRHLLLNVSDEDADEMWMKIMDMASELKE